MKNACNPNVSRIASVKRTAGFREHPLYDEKYCKEYEATVAGVFFFFAPVMFMVFSVLNFVRYEGFNIFINILVVGGMILRIIASLWVAKISREQNRRSKKWMAFAFLLPGSALMIIGQKKKFFDPSEWKKHLYNHTMSNGAARPAAQQQTLLLAS